MDQSLLNFWKNYEDVINWGYRMSGAREVDGNVSSSAPINTLIREIHTDANLVDEDNYSSDSSIDIDLEYLKFSKKTMEHQEEIEREKKKVDREYGLGNSPSLENESPEITSVGEITSKEFYGSKADEIKCIEDKLQSEFDSFCITNKPVLWPSMAFNLSAPGNLDNFITYVY